eukprot:COSAG01_NODE_63_length_29632_cov_270.650662_28_plen_142_part_00
MTRGWSVQNEFEVGPEVLQQIFRMRLQPVDLKVQTYVLETTPIAGTTYNGIYVGKTQNLSLRLPHHWVGTGARWTRLHKPLSIKTILLDGGETAEEVSNHENQVTLGLMRQFIRDHGPDGWKSVRGGSYTEVYMTGPPALL